MGEALAFSKCNRLQFSAAEPKSFSWVARAGASLRVVPTLGVHASILRVRVPNLPLVIVRSTVFLSTQHGYGLRRVQSRLLCASLPVSALRLSL